MGEDTGRRESSIRKEVYTRIDNDKDEGHWFCYLKISSLTNNKTVMKTDRLGEMKDETRNSEQRRKEEGADRRKDMIPSQCSEI